MAGLTRLGGWGQEQASGRLFHRLRDHLDAKSHGQRLVPAAQGPRSSPHPPQDLLKQLSKASQVRSHFCYVCIYIFLQVCVYINKYGNCGPHLDPKKIQQLPDHYGPGPVNVVLRRTVQACVDCAFQSKTVFGLLKPDHRGGEVITASFDGETHSIQLPPVNSASFALRFLETLCHSMECDNFLSSKPFSSYKGNTHSPAETNKPGERKCKFLYYTCI
uniref:SLED domain-containing protein n=1 Tax=Prolemur simus TaxID=1328070 RepID=A0A8C8Z965_PROSS